ncbi:hypothetical protein RRG08_012646 [Elysia crispata]|uniref:Uncharacterized protein n=1 Tax=Elysia crispata TaxID=231223 RepID=A0AAE0YMR8_9GAST|nr:hypothetical protein RRG08_012646 [Elysia crispata]
MAQKSAGLHFKLVNVGDKFQASSVFCPAFMCKTSALQLQQKTALNIPNLHVLQHNRTSYCFLTWLTVISRDAPGCPIKARLLPGCWDANLIPLGNMHAITAVPTVTRETILS